MERVDVRDKRFIVESRLSRGVPGCYTVEDLEYHLDNHAPDGYRLASCDFGGTVLLIWEHL